MKTFATGILVLASSTAFAQQAQQPSATPLNSYLKHAATSIQDNISKSAAKLAEADYAFRPAGVSSEVRTFGQLIAHIADSNYFFCARERGGKPRQGGH